MLALISDLHFCDGTATEGNVAPEVFALAMREIHNLAASIARSKNRPTHVDLVLLGDIFDLLRTERWFEDARGAPVPLEERPWGLGRAVRDGTLTPPVAARARSILDGILALNKESLATIRGERRPPPPGVEVRRIYIPGNHDRLFLHDAGLRAAILGALGAISGDGPGREGIFLHRLEMPAYGLMARHGHEWDVWNFPTFDPTGVAAEYTDEDYLPVPIGDPITTEIAARLPYELCRRLSTMPGFSRALVERVHRHYKRIEDVRPLFASFHWTFYAATRIARELDREQARRLRWALVDTLQSLARSFRDLDFYEAWIDKNHRLGHLDAACFLRLILWALSNPCIPLEPIARRIEPILASRNPMSTTRRGALREDLSAVGDREMRFVVYGHTHSPEIAPLRGGARLQDVYINTSTYRPGVFRADDGEGFVGWQRLAYVCLYSEEEAAGKVSPFGIRNVGPAFTAWAGARSAGAAGPVR